MDNKIIEALKGILEEQQVSQVATAVEEMLEGIRKELDAEYTEKLEEAYATYSDQLKAETDTAEKGYAEAHAIIAELRNRLELQAEEMKAATHEGYEEAYQMLQAEKAKNEARDVEMYEEYEKKLDEMKKYMTEKVDQFLRFKGNEIYEQAKRDVLNDPALVEHKVFMEKVVSLASDYLSDEEFSAVQNSKLDEASKKIEDLKGQIKLMESRTIKLSTENTKLNEAVRGAQEIINEHKALLTQKKDEKVLSEQKVRETKATNATGSGVPNTNKTDENGLLSEEVDPVLVNENMLKLAGL